MRITTIITVGLFFAILRIAGLRSEAFQALAHLYVGGLLGAYFQDRQGAKDCLVVAIVLSVVELACFLLLSRNP